MTFSHSENATFVLLDDARVGAAAQMGLGVAIVHVKNVNFGIGNDGSVAAIVGRGHLVERGKVLEFTKSLENSARGLVSEIAKQLVL